jgi:MFS family permease
LADAAVPARRPPAPDAGVSLRTVLGNTTFWLLAGSFLVCGGTSVGLIGTHLIPHEIDHGIPQVTAASVVGVMGGLNFVGTILSGWMVDRVEARKWLAFVYALRGLSLFILPLVQDVSGLFAFAVVYGLGWFATVPPTMAITADTFGTANVGRVYGWIFLAHQIGAAIMATTAGALRTSLGDYRLAFLSGGVVAMFAAGLALQARPRPPLRPQGSRRRAHGAARKAQGPSEQIPDDHGFQSLTP